MLHRVPWGIEISGSALTVLFGTAQSILVVFAFSRELPGVSSLSSAQSSLLDARVPGGHPRDKRPIPFLSPFPEKGRKSRLFLGYRPVLGHQKRPCRPPREG